MNLTEITSKRFDKSAFGYKPEAVDSFLTELASVVGRLQEENADLKNKLEILASKVEEYRQDEANMKDALLGAQKLGNNIISEAKANAEKMTADASAQSEQIISEAKGNAEKIVLQLRSQIESEQQALQKTKREVSDFKARLLALYKSHLDAITAIPEIKEEAKPEENTDKPENEAVTAQEVAEHTAEPEEQAENVPAVAVIEEKPQPQPLKKPSAEDIRSFESKFGELRFGRNSKK